MKYRAISSLVLTGLLVGGLQLAVADSSECVSNQESKGGAAVHSQSQSQSPSDIQDQCAQVGVTMNEQTQPARRPSAAELEARRKDRICGDNKHGTPLFLRQDLAYSVTGVDCFGWAPQDNYSTNNGEPPAKVRNPAATGEYYNTQSR